MTRWVPPAHSPLQWSDLSRVIGSDRRSQAHALDAVRRAFNADEVLLCDSGTAALSLALHASARTHPGAIAIPGYACFDIATALGGSEDAVLPYDIDPRTLGPDAESLARALNAGARRVVVAPLYGVPLDWDALRAQCDAAGALLIEDAAQASGAEWRGALHGSLGELAVLSFGRGKGRAAGGGGALVAHGARMSAALREVGTTVEAPRAARASAAFRISAQMAFSTPSRFGYVAGVPAFGVGETRLQPWHAPRAMSHAQAALVPTALAREESEIAVRRRHAARWTAELSDAARTPQVAEHARAGYLRFPIVLEHEVDLDRAQRQLGIGPSYPLVLSDLPVIAPRIPANHAESLPGARLLVTQLVTLPTHSLLTPPDCDAMSRWLAARR